MQFVAVTLDWLATALGKVKPRRRGLADPLRDLARRYLRWAVAERAWPALPARDEVHLSGRGTAS
jgi:hypothetical protein